MKRTMLVPFVLAVVLAGCPGPAPGPSINDAAPQIVPGGGTSSGAVNGRINIYVIDAADDMPIPGAAVRLGEPSDAAPRTGTADSTGLVVFRDTAIVGAQVVTASAAGYAASTWFGVNGANVTMPLQRPAPTVPSATVSGTIPGFDALPAPAASHYLLAVVMYSFLSDLGAPENQINQMGRNVCIRTPIANPSCAWEMEVRVGSQFHLAILIDGIQGPGGPNPGADPLTLIGYAVQTGLTFVDGQIVTGETLTMLAPSDLVDVTVSMQAPPGTWGTARAAALLNMGGQGMMPMIFPGFTTAQPSGLLPALAGDFATGTYDFLAQAAAMGGAPTGLILMHDVNITATVTFGSWMDAPTGVMASGGSYSFTPAVGATIHSASFRDDTRPPALVWDVALLDGRTSFSLPTLTPDPLPAGMINLSITALDLPGANFGDFRVNAMFDMLARMSETAAVQFTH